MAWSRPEYAQLATLIAERTGLSFPAARRPDVEQALGRALAERSIDLERLRGLLAGNTAARDELIANLTVGESYFFRDPAQFAVLREELLPDLAEQRGSSALRLWSAGCAGGEEPYSLAILCDELGLRNRSSVLGTDISRVRLANAQRAVYTKWSLRGLTDAAIEHYFLERGNAYTVRPQFREHVEFRYLNLADDHYPSLTAGIWGIDIILCRNVLIYFDQETVARVARRLIDSLSEDGWLLLGASDPAISEFVECDVVLTRSGLAYRRPGRGGRGRHVVPAYVGEQPWLETPPDHWGDAAEPVAVPPPGDAATTDGATEWWDVEDDAVAVQTGVADTVQVADPDAPALDADAAPVRTLDGGALGRSVPDTVRAAYAARDYARAAEQAAQLEGAHDSAELRVLHIRALANLGDLAGAGRVTAAALEKYRASAELMYLHAVLLSEAGRWRDAAAAARRALYLDRSLVVAHFALADALRRAGDERGAHRALCNADALLADWPLDVVVPATDGETAERLRANVRTQLRLRRVRHE